MSRPATRPTDSPAGLLRLLLIAMVLVLSATACTSGPEEDSAESDATEDVATEEEPEDEPTEEESAEEPEETAEPTDADTEAAASADADDDQVSAVVAARDDALAALPDGWTSEAAEPEIGPTGVDSDEPNPLNDCLPDDLQDLEGQVDALLAVSASGDFSAPATGEEAFGPASGSVTVNAYTDPGAAQDLLTQFGDAVSEPGFSDCVISATEGEFGEPPEGSEFEVTVQPEVPGVDGEVALAIDVTASFAGETVTFNSFFVLASRGDYIVEGQFTGDGVDGFPTDVASAVLDAVS